MTDGRLDVGNLIADVIGAPALFERTINGRVRPKRSDKLDYRISLSATQETDRYFLNGVRNRARDEFIVEQCLVIVDCAF